MIYMLLIAILPVILGGIVFYWLHIALIVFLAQQFKYHRPYSFGLFGLLYAVVTYYMMRINLWLLIGNIGLLGIDFGSSGSSNWAHALMESPKTGFTNNPLILSMVLITIAITISGISWFRFNKQRTQDQSSLLDYIKTSKSTQILIAIVVVTNIAMLLYLDRSYLFKTAQDFTKPKPPTLDDLYTAEELDTYVDCILPDVTEPVYHKLRACLTYGGTKAID